MTCDQDKPFIEPVDIVLTLAYITTLSVMIGWIATLLM